MNIIVYIIAVVNFSEMFEMMPELQIVLEFTYLLFQKNCHLDGHHLVHMELRVDMLTSEQSLQNLADDNLKMHF